MRIRLARPTDGPRLANIYEAAFADPPLSFELRAPNGSEMAKRVSDALTRFPWLVAESQSVLGYAYAASHRKRPAYAWSTEVSVYTAPEARRQGIGRTLYNRLFAVLGLQGYQNAYAIIVLPNSASCRFHEAMGFVHIGTFCQSGFKAGRWLDTAWYWRSLGDHPLSPRLPLLFPDLIGSQRLNEVLASSTRPPP